MSAMRIVYHHRTRAEDAQGVHIGAMVRAFRDLGHQVTIVSPLAPAPVAAPEGAREPALSRLTRAAPPWAHEALGLAYNLAGYRQLRRAILRERPDLLYERYSLNTLCGVWASRHFDIPLFLEVNSPLRREQAQLGRLAFGRLAQATERWVCSNATATIVVSGVMRDILRADGVADERLLVMPNGVDPSEFHPQVDGARVRRELGLTDDVVVGFVGWFRPWHGLEGLLRTMHEAGYFARGVRLLLVGDGPARPELDSFVRRHRLEARVIVTGAVERARIPAYVAAMDVAVQPEATEYACPMKLIEYMAMGRGIVAPRQANIRELVEDGRTAALFDAEVEGSLGAALDRVIGDPGRRRELGAAAAAAVQARGLFWQANAARVIDLYRQQRGHAPCTGRAVESAEES